MIHADGGGVEEKKFNNATRKAPHEVSPACNFCCKSKGAGREKTGRAPGRQAD
jgi:hypothetical protein